MVASAIDEVKVCGEDASLEITFAIGLHTNTCACEVRRPNIGHLAVENNNFEEYPRTLFALEAFDKEWVFVEIVTEIWAWLLGVE